jgi:predicted ATPase
MHLEQSIALHEAQEGRKRAFSEGLESGVTCLSVLAWALWQLGYPDQASTKSQEALALAHKSSHVYSLLMALQYSALLYQSRREPQHVQEISEETMRLAHDHGCLQWLTGGMFMHGWALAVQGYVEEGIKQLRQGMDTWQSIGTELAKTHTLFRLAEAYQRGGQVEEGLRVLDEALGIAHKNAEGYFEAEICRLKGELLLQQTPEKASEAQAWFQQALVSARRQQAKSLELRAALSLSRLWQQQGRAKEAYQLLAEISAWFTEGIDTPELQEAKALLDALV